MTTAAVASQLSFLPGSLPGDRASRAIPDWSRGTGNLSDGPVDIGDGAVLQIHAARQPEGTQTTETQQWRGFRQILAQSRLWYDLPECVRPRVPVLWVPLVSTQALSGAEAPSCWVCPEVSFWTILVVEALWGLWTTFLS